MSEVEYGPLGTSTSNEMLPLDPTYWSDTQLYELMHSSRSLDLTEDDLWQVAFELTERLYKYGKNS